MPPEAQQVCDAYKKLYDSQGYVPPWIGYFAEYDGLLVGSCGFKSKPKDEKVEIAYFTFPKYERRGIATTMARSLIEIARKASPNIVILAQTLPQENASTSILKNLGFRHSRNAEDPKVGLVWEWVLEPLGRK